MQDLPNLHEALYLILQYPIIEDGREGKRKRKTMRLLRASSYIILYSFIDCGTQTQSRTVRTHILFHHKKQ